METGIKLDAHEGKNFRFRKRVYNGDELEFLVK